MKQPDKSDRIAILIPAYNEATVIGDVITSLPRKIDGTPVDVIVIDDGSKDDTIAVSRKAGATVVPHILNSGSGGATFTGITYARRHGYRAAVTMDADGQHTSDDAVKVAQAILKGDADLVIGSRLLDAAGMPWYRQLGNWGLSFITYLLFGLSVTDSQSGLKGFSRRALDELRIKSTGYEFCSEIIWRAKQLGFTVKETPITAVYTDYSMAKGQSNWNAINIIKSLVTRKVLEIIDA